MKKITLATIFVTVLLVLAACSKKEEYVCPLEDGIYTASFDTDSSMFRVNETLDGKGRLTVKDGQMTIHVSLLSKKILNLYAGLAEDAAKEGAKLLQPTIDTVTYSDGMIEEVFGFDIPVPYLDDTFDVALVGTKGTWYDHKVSVSGAEPFSGEPGAGTSGGASAETASEAGAESGSAGVSDATGVSDAEAESEGSTAAAGGSTEDTETAGRDKIYEVSVTLFGGTGKSTISTPTLMRVDEGDQRFVKLIWSSKNYDYMLVDGVKYLNEAEAGQPSEFTIPVLKIGEKFPVIADTVAMSTPHEIEYELLIEENKLLLGNE